jgi:hypothetical protein
MYEVMRTTTSGLTSLAVAMGAAPIQTITQESTASYYTPDIRYRWVNLSVTVEIIISPIVGDLLVDTYRPRTELGRKLLELRREYIHSGGKLLSWEGLDEEMRLRRGGVPDE